MWFLEDVNKIDKSLASFLKKKRERVHVYKIRNEKEVTTDTTEIQRTNISSSNPGAWAIFPFL